MRLSWFFAATALVLTAGQPALACRVHAETRLEDVRNADVVVVGRITGYRIIRKEIARQQPPGDPGERKPDKASKPWIAEYARFDIEVDEVLTGKAPRRLTATWQNSTFGEPATLPSGPWLIALRNPPRPPDDPEAVYFSTPEPALPTVLQRPCASPILFEANSEQARSVRHILRRP